MHVTPNCLLSNGGICMPVYSYKKLFLVVITNFVLFFATNSYAHEDKLKSQRDMLINKLRSSGIHDEKVLAAIEEVPREEFVLPEMRNSSYIDSALPINSNQTISQPTVVAWMTQELELGEDSRVLEIGTGSGYQAAILSKLSKEVYTIERIKSLLDEADERFKKLQYENIYTRFGDGYKGWPEEAPFDRIIVTAGADELPQELLNQLVVGGIMVIPVESGWASEDLLKVTKTEDGVKKEKILDVRFVPMLEGVEE